MIYPQTAMEHLTTRHALTLKLPARRHGPVRSHGQVTSAASAAPSDGARYSVFSLGRNPICFGRGAVWFGAQNRVISA